MQINWKIRIKNKIFWVTIIPAILVLIKCILAIVGIDFDYTVLQDKLIDVVGAVFVVLSILGIVTDQTTEGISDSALSLSKDSVINTETVERDDDDRSDKEV